MTAVPMAPGARATVLDTVSMAMSALADPALVGTGAHEQVVERLRQTLRTLPSRPTGADGRAVPALRAACAHLAAEQVEDAFIALQSARDQYPT